MRGRLVSAQAARAGVPLVIVGAAVCRAAVPAAGVPPGVVCLGVCGVLAVGVGAGAGVAVVWCWLVSCCPVLLVVGGLGMMIPGTVTDLAGLLLVGAIVAYQYLSNKRASASAAA